MIVCIDVDYREMSDARTAAVAAGVVLSGFDAAQASAEHVCHIAEVADYDPGQFYKRELPCVLAVLDAVIEPIDAVVIDGYVLLDGAGTHGLGGYLFEILDRTIPVIGVAKNPFGSNEAALEVYRGQSKRPLYVTALGVDVEAAANEVAKMHGPFRLPTMLKRVDRLCRDSGC